MKIYKGRPYDEYYSFLDTISPKSESLPQYAHHDHLEGLRGRMKLEIQAISPVFVGTGEYEVDSQGIYQPFARTGERLVIPGTTIKGVVRTYAEALSPSCEGGRCDVSKGRVCIACRIFGALGFQGRVTFCDTEGLDPNKVKLRKYTMSVRWSGRRRDGRRFYYHNKPTSQILVNSKTGKPLPEERVEVVPKGTRFTSELIFENLSNEEMGLLLLAMGLSPKYRFDLKLGGGKNRRLGSVRFHLPSGINVAGNDIYTSFAPEYEVKDICTWGTEAVDCYLSDLSKEHKALVMEFIRAFQKDPDS